MTEKNSIKRISHTEKRCKSETSYSNLFREASKPILLLNPDGNILYINEATEQLINYRNEELIDNNIFEVSIIHPENHNRIREFFNSLNYGVIGRLPEICRLFTRENNIIRVQILAILLKIENEYRIQVIICKNLNNTAKLEFIEDRNGFKDLSNSLPDIVFEADLNLTLTYLNRCGYKTFNLTPKQLTEGIPIFDFICPEDKEKAILNLSRLLAREKLEPIELTLRKTTGECFYSRVHTRLIFENNLLLGFRGIIYDITKRKLNEELIKKENRRLKRINSFRKEFLDIAAHEFKTPLTSIYGATQILLEYYHSLKLDSSLEVFELLEIIKNGSEKLKDLILNLLDFSKFESGKIDLSKQKINLIEVINNCITDLKYLIYQKDHRIIFPKSDEIIINADYSKMERVFTNLISNSIKYTPSEGEISVAVERFDTYVLVRLKDNGVGLTEDELNNLFKRFNQFNKGMTSISDVAIEGTGLGLYITKKIIERHEGDIWAESEGKNKGTTFFIKLPLIEA
ncbi:MAG: putative Histidine kinase [Promethearchaeota archaeon]|nr:MAG: putative Histidine kinase [Candidatus Lokiarchaeota archaeon]